MCASSALRVVLDLGHHPPSDAFLSPEQLREPEVTFPLRLVQCEQCGLLQIDYYVDPALLFQSDYPYESSITATGRSHYRNMALTIADRHRLPIGSLAVDIGSNVGILLAGFKEAGFKVLGVDQAPNVARTALASGIDTRIDFFTSDSARAIREDQGKAHVITGTNVFAHLQELHDSVRGMRELLAEDGVVVIEAPYAVDLIHGLEYDTIYHEHIMYLSVKPMVRYLASQGLELFNAEKVSIHGGTLRYFIGHPGKHPVQPVVGACIVREEQFGLYDATRLHVFAKRVEEHKLTLLTLLMGLKKQGKRLAGLSAPAKGNTLLNYCHIDTSLLDFVTEKSALKIGRYTPGTHIPVCRDEELVQASVDYALILAWNFKDEIIKNQTAFRTKGKFIIPIPEPVIV